MLEEPYHSEPYDSDFGGPGPGLVVLVGLMLLAVGAWLALTNFITMADRVGELETFRSDGTVLLAAGEHTVYFQPDRGTDAGVRPHPELFGVHTGVSGPGGADAPERTRDVSIQITTPSFDGWYMLNIDAPVEGVYRVIVPRPSSGLPPGRVSIGPDIFGAGFRTAIASGLGLLLALGGAIAAIIGFAALRREQSGPRLPDEASF